MQTLQMRIDEFSPHPAARAGQEGGKCFSSPGQKNAYEHLRMHIPHLRKVFGEMAGAGMSAVPAFSTPLSEERRLVLDAMQGRMVLEDAVLVKLRQSSDIILARAADSLLAHQMYSDEFSQSKIRAVIESYPLFLNSRNSWFAAMNPSFVADRIRRAASLLERPPFDGSSGVLGVIIGGSIWKGYAMHHSDTDYTLIGPDEATREFYDTAKAIGLDPCASMNNSYTLNEGNMTEEDAITRLFHGIAIGRLPEIRKLQRDVLGRIDEKGWNEAVLRIADEVRRNEYKGRTRHGGMGALPFDAHIHQLLRVPTTDLGMAREVAIRNCRRAAA